MTDQCAACKRYLEPRIYEEDVIRVFRVQEPSLGFRTTPVEKKLCERCFTRWKESPPIGYIPALFNGVWTLVSDGKPIDNKDAQVKTDDSGDLVEAINRLATAIESLVKDGTR